MKRRNFIKAGSLVAAPFLIKGIPVSGMPHTGNSMLDMLASATYGCGKVLVIIQMNGGNDALNMILPLDKWQNLSNARANILMNQSSALTLNNNATTGLHPAMPEMKNLYDNGKLMIVQGVSYPNPNFSHFRATDIWFSASGSNTTLDTGWLGRELDTQYAGFPTGFPNADMPDPLAIQIGSTLPFSLQGPGINMGYNVTDPAALLNVINGITDAAPNNDYGRELSFLRLMKDQSNQYRTVIQNAYNTTYSAAVTYPTSNSLGDQLKIVAKLINGGLKTPIYIVNHPNSFDTHVAQIDINDATKTTGNQPNYFKTLSKAIGAFQADLANMGKENKVTGMTYSEFGRRIISNASIGTDHGSAAPVMFFGAALNTNPATVAGTANPVPGMIGTSPNIPLNATVNDQVPMQYDFRQLYASVMQDWLCLTPAQTDTVLGSTFTRLPIFVSQSTVAVAGITLTGQYFGGEAKLNYIVETNTKFTSFSIEFSTDGIEFKEVKRYANVSLNNSESYFYKESNSYKKMYYRIAATDHQGGITYSNIVALRSTDKEQLMSVYPNPVENNTIYIKLFESPTTPVDVSIYDMLGQKIYYNRFTNVGSTLHFKVPTFNANQHYVLEVQYGETKVHEQVMFR